MSTITFRIYYCGLSEENFSDNIMIYKPLGCTERQFPLDDIRTQTVSDIINLFTRELEKSNAALGEWETEMLRYENIYIQTADALIGLQKDKQISEIQDYFGFDDVCLAFFVVGGASIECRGYQFIVHPNEEIHRNTPHVHVRKAGNETRYYLETLSRFPKDKFSKEFQHDEKKIILPFLKEHQVELYTFWDMYMNGYVPPSVDQYGKQYYKES